MIFTTLLLSLSLAAADYSEDFQARQNELPSEIFDIFRDRRMTEDELEAMSFLYTYMPLPDLAGHDGNFHFQNVRTTLRAREEMPWGKSVPEREFRHFVLPLRVNNEALDNSRPVFYEMLADRVKGLSMKEAIQEVNHWCHEHVTYKPSDGRTSPPLSSMSQAIGRCGEESTFTVAALRAVGIPARQVYTPRWAHTDDNHAWVEAWADGEWYFLGACEPAPLLDMAWFNAPASRGMLMTTNVFGRYDGPEEKLVQQPLNTTINVTSKYAPVRVLQVRVMDQEGRPVEGADVAFSIFNYTDFYPASVKKSDANGYASLTTGMGDIVVWGTDGDRFGWVKGSPADGATLTLVLDKDKTYTGSFDMTIVPPRGNAVLPSPTPEQVAENDRRFQEEDRIRKAYEATFVTEEEARDFAESLVKSADRDKVVKILSEARGNSRPLKKFLSSLSEEKLLTSIELLTAVTEKDRRDIPVDVILDCADRSYGDLSNPSYVLYVLSPRIETEPLVPFKSEILSRFEPEMGSAFKSDPKLLIDWVRDNVTVETNSNPKLVRMDPLTVLNILKTDPKSRDIFFVAMARTFGIPSRIDPVTGKVQYMGEEGSEWIDVAFAPVEEDVTGPKGRVKLVYEKTGRIVNPRYYSQFSISKIDGGRPRQLEFDEEEGWVELCERNEPFDEGQYMLVTGQRMADGSVLAHGEIFNVTGGEEVVVPLILREDPNGVQVIGSLNAENLYRPSGEASDRSILSTTDRRYYVLGIVRPGHEPSAHALNDLSAVKNELEKWGRSIVVLFPDEDALARFDSGHFPSLPSNLSFGVDVNGVSADELISSLNLETSDLPVFVIADSFNRVVFAVQGYTIGLGDQLLDTISKLE